MLGDTRMVPHALSAAVMMQLLVNIKQHLALTDTSTHPTLTYST
jgi:hypothetical protein